MSIVSKTATKVGRGRWSVVQISLFAADQAESRNKRQFAANNEI
jgi:hypothetical protein